MDSYLKHLKEFNLKDTKYRSSVINPTLIYGKVVLFKGLIQWR